MIGSVLNKPRIALLFPLTAPLTVGCDAIATRIVCDDGLRTFLMLTLSGKPQ